MTDLGQTIAQAGGKSALCAPSRFTRFSLLLWIGLLAALFTFAAIAPVASGGLSFWFYLFQWITLATAINLVAGLVGYLPFGFVAFFGIGSYAAAVSIQFHGLSVGWSIAGAAIAGALLALLFAPTMRLTGGLLLDRQPVTFDRPEEPRFDLAGGRRRRKRRRHHHRGQRPDPVLLPDGRALPGVACNCNSHRTYALRAAVEGDPR